MSQGPARAVRLPRGLWHGPVGEDAGYWITDIELRPMNGRDEEYVAAAGSATRAEVVTALLQRCVVRIGRQQTDTFDASRLTIGDREALLMHLCRQQFGDRIDGGISCPDTTCSERLDLNLVVEQLLVDPDPDPQQWYEERFAGNVDIRFRLPTGADQHVVSAPAEIDANELARTLVDRCVDSMAGGAGPIDIQQLPSETLAALGARMAELDPQSEIRLACVCPSCARKIDVFFDAATYLLAEIQASLGDLLADIHALAWYYHWGEGEILDLPRPRRRQYLNLIAGSLEARSARGAA